jgi:hypothetical protein
MLRQTLLVPLSLLLTCLPALLSSGCDDELKPGFCNSNADCRTPERCELNGGPNYRKCIFATDAGIDAGKDASKDATNDRPVSPDAGKDVVVEGDVGSDVPLPCTGPSDCKDPNRPFCAAGTCVGCQSDAGTCPAGRGVCDPSSGACVECTANAQCTKPEAPLCTNKACAACAGDNAGCAARDPAHPVCAPSGRCAECAANDQCKTAGKPFCVMEACVGCDKAGPTACAGTTPVCNPQSGGCAECLADTDCKTATAPFCVANKCVACATAPAGRCAMRNPMVPACGPTGACVECNTSADCAFDPNRPICNTTTLTCAACTADAECVAKAGADPGVCLDNRGGRCATTEETIYVNAGSGCGAAGTKAMPLCSPQDASKLWGANRALVLVRGAVAGLSWTLAGAPPLTVVGQQQGVINGGVGAGIKLDGAGEVLFRGLTVRGSETWAVNASGGATLGMRGCAVQNNNGGGILIDGGRFDLRATVISGNGPGQTGTSGGMSVQAVAGAPARLENVSIKMNGAVGLTCAVGVDVMATGLYASGNVGIDVAMSCKGVATCPTEGAGCGSP